MMCASIYNDHTSWRHIWRLAWPITISNVTVLLVEAVDVAMMGRIDDPTFIGGVGLGMMLFDAIYFGMGFLRMGTTGLVAQSQDNDATEQIARITARGLVLAFAIGVIIILATAMITSIATAVFSTSELVESLIVDYAAIRLFAVPAALGNMVVLGVLYGRQQMFGGMLLLLIVNVINLMLDGIFVGATLGQDMRNAMLFSAGGLGGALFLFAPWGLQGLLAAFVGYLGLRSVSLWWHIDRVYAQTDPSPHRQ